MDGNNVKMALDEIESNSDLLDFEYSGSEYVSSYINSEDTIIDFEEIVPQHVKISHSLNGELF